jgi:hypothetical protein
MYRHHSAAIFFGCRAIRYGRYDIYVTSAIFCENITLHAVFHISVCICVLTFYIIIALRLEQIVQDMFIIT